MIDNSLLRINIVDLNNEIGHTYVLIDNRSPENLNTGSRLVALPSLNATLEIDLKVEGFDFVEISKSGEKFISGSVFARQALIDGEVLTLLNTPKYLLLDQDTGNQEQLKVRQIKKLITQQWSSCFSDAVDKATKPQEATNTISEVAPKLSLSNLSQQTMRLARSLKEKKKSLLVLTLAILIILANAVILTVINDAKDQYKTSKFDPKTAEQLATEQDQILNNAFKEIGIDREKLASDMSCFTE